MGEVDPERRSGARRCVDDQAGCDERRQRVGYVDVEVGDLAMCSPAECVEVADTVQRKQKRVQTRAVTDDDARAGTHLQVRGIATQKRRAGSNRRSHRATVTKERPAREPDIHTSSSYALPRIRFSLVEHTGQTPFAILVPLSLTWISPVASRLALHFTQ